MKQAQDISLYKYKVNRTIQLGPLVYIIDIDGNRDGVMCLSTSSSVEVWYKNIQCQSPSGGYVAFQGEMNGQLQFIYGNKNSVLKQCVKSQLCIEPVVLWGKNTNIYVPMYSRGALQYSATALKD